ncbi:TerD family protein [Gordonia sputi]|uniref:TerD family protein n=1 Tax=Gordonia sputi TaxID=36823 RepID=UPI00368680AF
MTTVLSKGQNAPLPAGEVTISVDVAAPVDLSALLVTSDMRVRSDADFVFYNQPTGAGVTLAPTTGRQTLRITPAAVPAEIHAVRAVITLDDASSSFGRTPPPVAHVFDAAGTELFSFPIPDLSSETVVVAVEVYRRDTGWKVRSIGQGYAGGFADLVRDHGVSVDDAPAAAAPAAPPAPPAAPAPPSQFTPPPTQFTPPPAPPQAQPAPPQQPAEISLSKNKRVNLVKGQKVTLRKDGGVALTLVRMGLGWDPVKKRGFFGGGSQDIDLDASVMMYSRGSLAEAIYFGHLRSTDNSIVHSGDNLTGEGDGDDEVIRVNLQAVPSHIDNLAFIVTSYRGQTFEAIDNAFCRLVDDTTGAELARFTLRGGMPFTGVLMAVMSRSGGDWKMRAVGDGFQAKTPREAERYLGRYLE